ncbi:quinone oxidoreductase family protein [Rathayibacter sp. CAU 1779]
MHAVLFDGPASDVSRTRIDEVARPKPGVGQVLIRVSYAGVNFKDVMVRRGDPGYADSWPAIPGLEVSGTIADVGPSVVGFAPGDEVAALTNSGGLADYALAAASLVARVPAGVPLDAAAVAPGVLTTAALLVDDAARIRSGDIVVVHSAAGAVGQAISSLAAIRGDVRLIGVVGAPARVPAAIAAGYESAFVRGPSVAAQVRDHLGGRRADVILDPQGTAGLEADLDMLEPLGRVILFGNANGGAFAALPPTARLFAASASIGGYSLAGISAARPELIGAALTRALASMAAGDVTPQRTVVSGLAAAPELQQRLAEGRGEGKYVIRVA